MRFYLKPRNGIWYICWTVNGRPDRLTTGTRDRSEADLKLARHVLQHARPRDQELADVTLEAVLVRYWQHHARHLFDPATVRHVISLVSDSFGGRTVRDFDIPAQESFVAGLGGVSAGTARRYLGVIRAALEWSAARQEIAYAPRVLRIPVQDGEGARPFSPAELRKLLEAAQEPHQRAFFLLALTTGARPEAILQLTWDRVKDGIADFHVPGRRKTKKRRTRSVLAPTVQKWLEDHRRLGPVVEWQGRPLKGHRMTFKRVAARAGVTGTAYGLRKACATWLRQQNVPEWEVGAQLGHRVSSATTERYAHHRPDYMAATRLAMEALIREICPGWLASYLPEPAVSDSTQLRIPRRVNDLSGSREWDRTTDHLHVKDTTSVSFQELEAANDD